MAGKIKTMSQIKQLLRMHKQGTGKKSIAKYLGISKNTVKSYLLKLEQLNTGIDQLLLLDDPELEKRFFAGNPAYKDERFDIFKENIDYFVNELKKNGVNKRLVWEEYKVSYPNGYGYTQFCHHLKQHAKALDPSMVLIHNPGEKLYVDFAGKHLSYVDQETGEIIECPVFVACLPYSDYAFVMALESQGLNDFIYALSSCLEYIGGAPRILVPDNLKAAVIKADRYEPGINRALEDFCNHYEMTVIPARVARPKDKALVEAQVRTIYTRVYAKLRKQKFFDIHSLNEAIKQKLKQHNQTRMQKKPYCREEKFLADEKHLLKPLPTTIFEIKYYKNLKVAKNNHVQLTCDLHYYSVPYQLIGQKVKVIYTRSMVRIYAKGEQVAVHPRDYRLGKYSTIKEHLCSHHQHYLDRSPSYYINKAHGISPELTELIKLIFKRGNPPEQNYRSCDGLLSLARKTKPEVFNLACKYAIECRAYSYKFIRNVIDNQKYIPNQQEQAPTNIPDHENIRGKDYYQQSLKFK